MNDGAQLADDFVKGILSTSLEPESAEEKFLDDFPFSMPSFEDTTEGNIHRSI